MWKHFFVNFRIFRRRWFYPVISVLVAVSLCLTTALPGRAIDLLPLILQGVQVIQLSNISNTQEFSLGKEINEELIGSDVKLYRNSQVNRYVESIGRRLVPNSDRPNLEYTFQVVDDDSINAFATVGGFVYLNTGLIKAADNEAELASVIAHEIGHIGGRHAVSQMRQSAIDSGIASALKVDRNQLVRIGVQLARTLPSSRNNEFDADKRGLRTLSRSGYSQSAMLSFMQKLLKKRSAVPTVLSTHPNTSDRIKSLQSRINKQPSNGGDGLDNSAYRANIQPLLK